MKIRDQFAMAALTGILSNKLYTSRTVEEYCNSCNADIQIVLSRMAYFNADAMLKVRNEVPKVS